MIKISQQKVMIWPFEWIKGFFPVSQKNLQKLIPKPIRLWTSSARSAIYITIKQIQKQKSLNSKIQKELTIAVPAFTCNVVQKAVKIADANIIYYDSGVTTNLNSIKSLLKNHKKSLPDAIILSYNFGYLPDNITQIINLLKKHNIIIIEDCAQALGTSLAGSFGDYAIYSFGISKNISFTGGLIASEKNISKEIYHEFPNQTITNVLSAIIKSTLAPIILNPIIFPITQKLLKNTISKKDNNLLKYKPNNFTKKVVCHLAKRYDQVLKKRKKNYKLINKKNSDSSCLYQNLLVKNKKSYISLAKKQNIELDDMKSFVCFDNSFPLAKQAQEHLLTFALLRSDTQIFKIKKFLEQSKNYNKISKIASKWN
ncbi:DegT/DnrJ/EryC1/StrS aminotransferase family protein [archaeon]|jgi:dTDP-4-amino-4,6-dideoxygalactose transaminase|nr:DegT/DnrJ/EryC1/StrS aminotransferase family protein [archaeon]MBT6697601.1 DegT/DnrJ/EryC1/StrS aminotransferase family protein [archaeon]